MKVKDPNCGMTIDSNKARFKAKKEGNTYYFCSQNCRDEFLGITSKKPEQPAHGKQKYTVTISGMHCASCAGTIEKAVKKVKGVANVSVNFASEKALVEFDPLEATTDEIDKALHSTGYKVVKEGKSMLKLKVIGMDNPHCVATVRGGLDRLDGIVDKELLVTEKATITYDPSKTTPETIKAAINALGYKPIETGAADVEQQAREKETRSVRQEPWPAPLD